MQLAVRYENATQGKALLDAHKHVQDIQSMDDMEQGLMMVECHNEGYDYLQKIPGVRVDVVKAMHYEE